MTHANRRPFYFLGTTVALLSLPLIAMQFTQQVDWSLGDFTVMAILLVGLFTAIELTLRLSTGQRRKLFYVAVLLLVFLLIYAELAVGLFGTPFAGS